MKRCLMSLALAAAALQLAACGGGSSSSGSTSAPAGVSGVVTPKAVSVVTAN